MTWDDGRHLFGLYDALYATLGSRAGTFSNDAAVIRSYELSRLFGEQALALRAQDCAGPTDAALTGLLAHAADEDPTGVLTLFFVTMVVSPRLLVWLRDLSESELPDEAGVMVRAGQALLVSSMYATGERLAELPLVDTTLLETRVPELLGTLTALGWDEHLGPRR